MSSNVDIRGQTLADTQETTRICRYAGCVGSMDGRSRACETTDAK